MRTLIVLFDNQHFATNISESDLPNIAKCLTETVNNFEAGIDGNKWVHMRDGSGAVIASFKTAKILGFYHVPLTESTQEKMVKVLEKAVGDASEGDKWKKPEE